MSQKPTFKAEVTACYLAGDAARLASSMARISQSPAPVYVENARKQIEAMRASLIQIEGVLKAKEAGNV